MSILTIRCNRRQEPVSVLKIFKNSKFAALFLGLILGGGGRDPVMEYHTLSHATRVYEFGYQKFNPGWRWEGSCYGLPYTVSLHPGV